METAASILVTRRAGTDWTFPGRFAFRAAFIWGTLFCLTGGLPDLVLWMVPGSSAWLQLLNDFIFSGAIWIGVHIFGLMGEAATKHPTGSGDTALQYIFHLCLLVVSLAGAAVWSAISETRRGSRDYHLLYAWLRLALRFLLGGTLLTYGFDKFFPLQFPAPSVYRLSETFGESSPMGILWTFMGASPAYTVFGGLAEIGPGVLLLFRRTSTLGALLAAGVLLNVVALNFCYDVPVKLFSTQLFLIALLLLLADAPALWRIFFTGQAAALTGVFLPRWERRSLRWAARSLQVLVLGAIFYQTGLSAYRFWRDKPSGRPPLYGVWQLDHAEPAELQTAINKIVFDQLTTMSVYSRDGERKFFDTAWHADTRTLDFPKAEKPSKFTWLESSERSLTLSGEWLGAPATITLHKINPDRFPLQQRGFHWLQEYPYNH